VCVCAASSAVGRCLAQLAVVPEGREALRRDPSVHGALQSVAEAGLSEFARNHAQSALLALSDNQLHATTEGQKHVMLSCESLCIAEMLVWQVLARRYGKCLAVTELTRACALQTNGMYRPQFSASTSC